MNLKPLLLGASLWGLSLMAAFASEPLLLNGDLSLPEGGGPEAEAWELATPFTGERVPHEDGGYCLSVEARSDDDDNATWVQRGVRLDPNGNYLVTYRAKAEPGQQYRGYIEYWNLTKTNAYPQGGQWQTGNGEWQEHSFNVTYKEGMQPPYIALNVKAPGKALFSHISITDLDAEAQAATDQTFELEHWTLAEQARLIPEGFDGKVIELRSGKEGDPAYITLANAALTPGQRYRLSYEVKAVSGEAATSTGFQYFRVYTGNTFGAPVDGDLWQDCFEGWQTRHLEFSRSDDASSPVRFFAELKAPGAMLIRNFSLETVDAGKALPFALNLQHPGYRQTLYGSDTRVAGQVTVTEPGVATVEVVLEQGGKAVATQSLRPSGNAKAPLDFEFAGEGLTDGEAHLLVRAFGEKGEIASDRLPLLKVPVRSPAVLVGEDLVMRQDGKPFYPIILWSAPANHRQMSDLHKAGFNAFVAPLRTSLLDAAARFNMKLVGDLERPRLVARENDPAKFEELEPKLREVVERYSSHPALLGWYIADEPLWNGRPLSPLRWTYSQLRKIDPYHPVWINEAPRNTVEELARFAAAADIFGVDIYPVPQGGTHSELEDRSLSSVGKYTDRFHETVAHRKPIWMVLQGFAWLTLHDRKAEGVYPTWEESRFMAYNAIVHDAHGLVYWGTQFITEPEFWDSLLRTTREVADLSALLVEPNVREPGLKVDHAAIAFLHKRHDDHDYFIVINESDQPVEAAFELKAVANRLYVQFEDRTVPVHVGKFRDTFKPWDVHVYSTSETLPPPLVETLEGLPDDGKSFQEEARQRKAHTDFESKANWIWSGEMQSGETVRFRRSFPVRAGLKAATLWVTGDDFYDAYLNGRKIGSDHGLGPTEEERGGWMTLEGYDVAAALTEGEHLLAMEVRDAGQLPAGLLVDLHLEYADGTEDNIVSDSHWKATRETTGDDWISPRFDDHQWAAATVVVPYGSGPWRKGVQPVRIP